MEKPEAGHLLFCPYCKSSVSVSTNVHGTNIPAPQRFPPSPRQLPQRTKASVATACQNTIQPAGREATLKPMSPTPGSLRLNKSNGLTPNNSVHSFEALHQVSSMASKCSRKAGRGDSGAGAEGWQATEGPVCHFPNKGWPSSVKDPLKVTQPSGCRVQEEGPHPAPKG